MKTIKFLAIVVLSAAVAMGMSWLLILKDASDRTVICAYFMAAIVLAGILGAFDAPAKKQGKFNVIRRKKTSRKAA